MKKIRKGDEVVILTGRDKGSRGRVSLVLPDKDRVLVENVNVVKRHIRPNPAKNIAGGIVDKEMPIHVSNVAIFNSSTSRPDKVGIRTLEDGRKVRFFKSTNEVIDT